MKLINPNPRKKIQIPRDTADTKMVIKALELCCKLDQFLGVEHAILWLRSYYVQLYKQIVLVKQNNISNTDYINSSFCTYWSCIFYTFSKEIFTGSFKDLD